MAWPRRHATWDVDPAGAATTAAARLARGLGAVGTVTVAPATACKARKRAATESGRTAHAGRRRGGRRELDPAGTTAADRAHLGVCPEAHHRRLDQDGPPGAAASAAAGDHFACHRADLASSAIGEHRADDRHLAGG